MRDLCYAFTWYVDQRISGNIKQIHRGTVYECQYERVVMTTEPPWFILPTVSSPAKSQTWFIFEPVMLDNVFVAEPKMSEMLKLPVFGSKIF